MKKMLLLILLLLTACTNVEKRGQDESSDAITHESDKNTYAFYEKWKGTPYKYGGTTIDGVDCSGFAQILYNEIYQIKLPRTTLMQLEYGSDIDYFERKRGDLVFFKTGVNTYHVGVYYENDNFMHASTSKGVMISNLNEEYWLDNFIGIKRILKK